MPKIKVSNLLAAALSVSIIGSSSTAFASSNESNIENNKTWTESATVVSVGENIGDLKNTYEYHKSQAEDGSTTVKLTVSKHYELSPEATVIQKEEFSDHTDTYEFKIDNDGEYFVNGEKLTQQELNTPITAPTQNTDSLFSTMAVASQDTGGIPSITHYYGDFTNYHLSSYDGVSILGNPKGSNHTASGKISNPYVQRAMSLIDGASSNIKTRGSVRKMRIYNAKHIFETIPPFLTTLRKFQWS
ncbi:hypothetical protein [Paenibacillus shenyangensis]|uniref:hypothetical protein n=1 Tax=Paenibacillus sp. A9 TaxID=1284352 RepID=UPI00037E800D|nr:hypothetical protein [Paenibacillus sp. A9]